MTHSRLRQAYRGRVMMFSRWQECGGTYPDRSDTLHSRDQYLLSTTSRAAGWTTFLWPNRSCGLDQSESDMRDSRIELSTTVELRNKVSRKNRVGDVVYAMLLQTIFQRIDS